MLDILSRLCKFSSLKRLQASNVGTFCKRKSKPSSGTYYILTFKRIMGGEENSRNHQVCKCPCFLIYIFKLFEYPALESSTYELVHT